MADVTSGLLESPVHERHAALGAKFAAFGGWSMPLEYAGGGVLAEHAAVRQAVGLFDVSHLGKVQVDGPGAAAHVNSVLTNDLGRIGPGRAQYTLLCTEAGEVVDDLIAYLRDEDHLLLIPNAANAAAVAAALAADAPAGVAVADRHRDFAVLALQGPHADEVLHDAGAAVSHDYMAFVEAELAGVPVTVCRTGYTGERGYELVVPADAAVAVWDALVAAGEAYGLRPAGLGARDTLRTEMGYPLHGADLGGDITPLQARLGWAVGWDKPGFTGAAALRAERQTGPSRLLRGLRAAGRGIPRAGMAVLDPDADPESGTPVGVVTSGTFSPTLKTGIALALVSGQHPDDSVLAVDVRGRPQPFVLVKPPFVKPSLR